MTEEEQKQFDKLQRDQLGDNGIAPTDFIKSAIKYANEFQDMHAELLDHQYNKMLSELFMSKEKMLELLKDFLVDNNDDNVRKNLSEIIEEVDNAEDTMMKVTLGNSDDAINRSEMNQHIDDADFTVKGVTDLDKITAFNVIQQMVGDYQDELDW